MNAHQRTDRPMTITIGIPIVAAAVLLCGCENSVGRSVGRSGALTVDVGTPELRATHPPLTTPPAAVEPRPAEVPPSASGCGAAGYEFEAEFGDIPCEVMVNTWDEYLDLIATTTSPTSLPRTAYCDSPGARPDSVGRCASANWAFTVFVGLPGGGA